MTAITNRGFQQKNTHGSVIAGRGYHLMAAPESPASRGFSAGPKLTGQVVV